MLSIIDVKDFIDLDNDTIEVVRRTLGVSTDEATTRARQLLANEQGLVILHHMFGDLINEATMNFRADRKFALEQAFASFRRKYPLPHIL